MTDLEQNYNIIDKLINDFLKTIDIEETIKNEENNDENDEEIIYTVPNNNRTKKYKAPIGTTISPFMKCPVNTLYIENINLEELEYFKKFKGFIEIKVVVYYSFITFDTVENATNALNSAIKVFNCEISYANSPTISTTNKKYKYTKYKSSKSSDKYKHF